VNTNILKNFYKAGSSIKRRYFIFLPSAVLLNSVFGFNNTYPPKKCLLFWQKNCKSLKIVHKNKDVLRNGMIAKRIIFTGNVQGIGFRFTAHNIARRYGLAGFVRNLPDGSVEMFAQGRAEDIEQSLRDISETFAGYISETLIEEVEPDNHYKDFRITF
jgi:acylphosphatase